MRTEKTIRLCRDSMRTENRFDANRLYYYKHVMYNALYNLKKKKYNLNYQKRKK